MSKTAEQKDATVSTIASELQANQGVVITPDLIQLISMAVAAAVKEANRDEDKEKQKANDEAARQIVRREEEMRLANIKARQDSCPHLDSYEKYAFCGQKNCAGQLVFLCSQCIKPFAPGDPEYNHYLKYVKWDRLGNARLG